MIQVQSASVPGLDLHCIAAELTTASGSNVATSEAEGTSVTATANDAVVTSSSVDDGVSSEVSTQQVTQQASSSPPQTVTLTAEQSNSATSTHQTKRGTTTDLGSGTTLPTTEADTTNKEQTQSSRSRLPT